MRKLNILLSVIGLVQIVLGLLYLFAPLSLLGWMGHSIPAADIGYPLGMLAARFIAYGLGMFYIVRSAEKPRFWIDNMILIQAIDLGVGIVYTATGIIDLSLSAFPMFNATLFIVLLWLWRPTESAEIAPAT